MILWLAIAGTMLRFEGPEPISIATHGVSIVASRGVGPAQHIYLHVETTDDRAHRFVVHIEDPIDASLRGHPLSVTGTFASVALGPSGARRYWLCVPGPRDAHTLYATFHCTALVEPHAYWLYAEPALLGDLNGDGRVDGTDVAYLLGAWDTTDVFADVDGSGCVDGADLSLLLGGWTS